MQWFAPQLVTVELCLAFSHGGRGPNTRPSSAVFPDLNWCLCGMLGFEVAAKPSSDFVVVIVEY